MNISELPTGATLLGGGAAIATLTMLWGNIKIVLSKIYSIFVIRMEVSYNMAEAVRVYCWAHFKRVPFGIRSIEAMHVFLKKRNKHGFAAIEKIGKDPVIFFKGILPIFYGEFSRKEGDGTHTLERITFLRFTVNPDKFIKDCVDEFNEKKLLKRIDSASRRFFINYEFGSLGKSYELMKKQRDTPGVAASADDKLSGVEMEIRMGVFRLIGLDINDIGRGNENKEPYINYLAFDADVMESILEIERWLKSESWYGERGIPWKRGWILHGIPGTGKSSLVRALAEHLDMPLYVYDLTTMTNEDFITSWRAMLTSAPCIALLEDMDTVFTKRENLHKNAFTNSMTFDCLLNVIDGVEKSNGIFTIITTNHIEKIDSAIGVPINGRDISTRPGRMDRAIELKELDEDCRYKLAKRILSNGNIDNIVKEGNGDTGAQFQERCSRIALIEYWNKENAAKKEKTA